MIADERVTLMAQTPTFFLAMAQVEGFYEADVSCLGAVHHLWRHGAPSDDRCLAKSVAGHCLGHLLGTVRTVSARVDWLV